MNQVFLFLFCFFEIFSADQVSHEDHSKKDSLYFYSMWDSVKNEGKPEYALKYATRLVEFSRERKNKKYQALALKELYLVHRDLGNVEIANAYYLESQKIFSVLGNIDDLAAGYAQEASLLMLEGQYGKSIEEYIKSLDIYKNLQDTLMTNIIRVNLGETYRLYEKQDSASYYLKLALEENYLKDEIIEGYGTGNLGMVYFALDRPDSAQWLLERSIAILEPLGDVYSLAVYEFELGKVLVALGQAGKGEIKMLKAYDVALREGLKEQVRDFSQHLSVYFSAKEDYRSALNYQRQYELYKDSLINIDNVRKVEKLRGQHEVEQRDAEISFLNELNKSQQNTLLAIGSGSVVLMGLLGLLYRNNQQKKRANIALAKREKEKGLLLQELNHRTKNNLNMISSLLNLQSNELGDAPAAEAVRQGRYRVDSLALIHKKLYQEDYSSIHMQQYLKELLEHLNESFDPEVVIDTSIGVEQMAVDKAIPIALIVNELVTNALKYGKASDSESIIRVSLHEAGKGYELRISDNGPGMEEPKPDQLSSFGLKLIYSLTDQLDGSIAYSNTNGSKWTITFEP